MHAARAKESDAHALCSMAGAMRTSFIFVALVLASGCAISPDNGTRTRSTWPSSSADGGSTVANAEADADTSEAAATAADAVFEANILTAIAKGAYRTSPDFAPATRIAYPSTAAAGSTITEWVTATARDAYVAISPTTTGSHSVPVGTTIVREVRDASGALKKLTLMSKGLEGYNPDLGDWWFGETDPDGAPLMDGTTPLMGRMTQCYSCHIPRSGDDFLFGVPADDHPTPSLP